MGDWKGAPAFSLELLGLVCFGSVLVELAPFVHVDTARFEGVRARAHRLSVLWKTRPLPSEEEERTSAHPHPWQAGHEDHVSVGPSCRVGCGWGTKVEGRRANAHARIPNFYDLVPTSHTPNQRVVCPCWAVGNKHLSDLNSRTSTPHSNIWLIASRNESNGV